MLRRQGSLSRQRISPIIKDVRRNRRPGRGGYVFRFFFLLSALVVILGIIAGAILAYLHFRVKGNEQEVGGLSSDVPAEPMNVLVLGSDSRENLTEEQRKSFGTIGGKRADTIILLHLDEEREQVILVHFPRDLRIKDPAGRPGKINTIYNQGPEAMVRTVSDFTGLPINHYIEVDFNGFNRITEALGGVDVYFEKALRDQDSGLNVPKGCVTIEGDQALAFVRARKIDDDFGRIDRQQLYAKLMLDKIATPGTLLNPSKVLSLINVFANNVKHDADLDLGDVKTIGLRVRSFNSSNIDMRVVPSQGARIDGVAYVVSDEEKTKALFDAIRNGSTLPDYGRTGVTPLEPSDVKLAVLNGTPVDKLAANEAAALTTKGFIVLGTDNTSPHSKTTVYFFEGFEEKGRFVATSYGAESKPMPSGITLQNEVEVALVLGDDFAAAKGAPPAPGASQAPGAPSTSEPQAQPPRAPAKARPLVHSCAA